MAGATGMRYNFSRQNEPVEAPLFERMGNDEYLELQQCRLIIENLQQRVMKLEKINLDLEYRLEEQAKQSMAVEKECLTIERNWKEKCEQLEEVIDKQKEEFEKELQKSARLREHLSRTERELYGILQRKYELMRGPGTNRAARAQLGIPSDGGMRISETGSWEGEVEASRPKESKKARERKVVANLSDFLGF